ncbi:MAG: AAA family ATPase [Candidatus Sulfotelmatobacter sp.]
MLRFNPFRPNEIVHQAMFAGRYDELVALEQALFQTKNGNPAHFLIDGERGIGKSSLLLLNLKLVADGELETTEDSQSFKFITVSVSLDANHAYQDVVRCVGAELRRKIAEREQLKKLARNAWDFLKKWEVAGVKFHEDRKDAKDTELIEELTFAIAESLKNLGPSVDGVLILIDEADKPPASANLGALAKLLTERLKIRGCDRVCVGFAGLTALREKLRKSHESSLRLFRIFALEPLSQNDSMEVINRGLKEAQERNGFPVTITPEALSSLAYITEGYPHFIQQFAYCAFEADTDNNIDPDDVLKGAFGESGALKQLGLKYFEKQYFEQIGSDEYRQVLRVMAKHFDAWVAKAEIRKEAAGIKSSTLDNALSALKSRGIILAKSGTKGTYKLPSRSFAVWIRAYTQAEELVASANIPGQQSIFQARINQ